MKKLFIWDFHGTLDKGSENAIEPNDHAHEVLKTIQDSSHEQIMISNMEVHMLQIFLKAVGIDIYFPKGTYFATNAHLGSQFTKQAILESYLRGKSFDHLVAIGDSPHDLEVVMGRSGTTYLYAYPGREFREFPATYRIRDLREILREI